MDVHNHMWYTNSTIKFENKFLTSFWIIVINDVSQIKNSLLSLPKWTINNNIKIKNVYRSALMTSLSA